MQNLILKFVDSARAAGLRVSTSETIDCLNQLQHIDPLEEAQFSRTLRANFAKSHRDQHLFNHLYDLFFHELRDNENLSGSEKISHIKKEIKMWLKADMNADGPMAPIIDFLDGNPSSYLQRLRQIESEGTGTTRGIGSGFGGMVRRLDIMLSINRTSVSISQFLAKNRSRVHWETRQDIEAHYQQRLSSALRLLTRNRTTGNSRRRIRKSYDRHLGMLGETAFTSLTKKEVQEMRDAIRALVRKLKDTVTLRYAVRARGVLDVKKTLRKAAPYQGLPMEIVYRKKPPRRGKIVVLCDVSGSVWSSAKFMLNMLYSLQECFTKVRSFVFVSGLDEASQFFEDHDVDQAIDRVMSDADIAYDASTDYGQTFREFKADYLDILNKKTTLIIIGDGRSNYTNPEAGILNEMREKCRRVLWLNPETEVFWYSGDSEMRTYQGICNEVRPCGNLNQLIEFIRELIL
jgi:uncharacterized protein with von Willebrand factor type A (vWA) domain